MIQLVKWHPRDDAFELIVKSKDRCIHCGCHHAIYLLASHRNPKDEDRPAAWHTGKGLTVSPRCRGTLRIVSLRLGYTTV